VSQTGERRRGADQTHRDGADEQRHDAAHDLPDVTTGHATTHYERARCSYRDDHTTSPQLRSNARAGSAHAPGALVALLTESLRVDTTAGDRLVRWSLTPPGDVEDVGPAARAFAERLHRRGESCWLVEDRRPKTGARHLFGLGVVRQGTTHAESIALWCEASGAKRKGQGSDGPLPGWPEFRAGGDGRLLDDHLTRIVNYALHPWPVQYGERDLNTGVHTAGLLRHVWETFWAPAATAVLPTPPPVAADAQVAVLTAPRRYTGGCAACGASLEGRRADCVACSGACRQRLHRSRKARGAAS
jgi:hypothetical protein